jgi:hypothetical protein
MTVPIIVVDGTALGAQYATIGRGVGIQSALSISNAAVFTSVTWILREQPDGAHAAIGAVGNQQALFATSIGAFALPGRYLVEANGDDVLAWADFFIAPIPEQFAVLANGGGQNATPGTIGGSGPANAAQAGWEKRTDVSGATYFVPIWR